MPTSTVSNLQELMRSNYEVRNLVGISPAEFKARIDGKRPIQTIYRLP